ncbi:alpha/beta hydrolase family protein [Halalkalibacter alkaliphilus]|uniref:Alpha/beta hydrolase n=1 Tax=Halalkalibacter alkaliphilus TaxID=2917993 RepID=A0A9X1ZVT4_9BACI|nr:alpha/beta hydrolase [Halalkalibacter alkaliphilus]MCL7745563.1 alpha/beta hydrolase [Halalkalibacter alkaliphilus]
MEQSFVEKEVSFTAEYELQGTLTLPRSAKKVPAVLIISGSGPGNRDGNIKWPKIELNIYKDLAAFFTSLGFATLRYDKRGTGKSKGKFNKAGMWDFVNDAKSGVEFLKNQPEIDRERVFVLGHSEGVTLAIALNSKERLAGIILLAGTYQSMEHTLRKQRKQLFQELQDLKGFKGFIINMIGITKNEEKKTKNLISKINSSKRDSFWHSFMKVNAKWLREHLSYNVQDDIKKIQCPVLAITGAKDAQVDCREVYIAKELNPIYVDSYIIDKMNHILKEQDYDNSFINIAKEYKSQSTHALHEKFVEVVKEWVKDK